jgi:hypothetical protein
VMLRQKLGKQRCLIATRNLPGHRAGQHKRNDKEEARLQQSELSGGIRTKNNVLTVFAKFSALYFITLPVNPLKNKRFCYSDAFLVKNLPFRVQSGCMPIQSKLKTFLTYDAAISGNRKNLNHAF